LTWLARYRKRPGAVSFRRRVEYVAGHSVIRFDSDAGACSPRTCASSDDGRATRHTADLFAAVIRAAKSMICAGPCEARPVQPRTPLPIGRCYVSASVGVFGRRSAAAGRRREGHFHVSKSGSRGVLFGKERGGVRVPPSDAGWNALTGGLPLPPRSGRAQIERMPGSRWMVRIPCQGHGRSDACPLSCRFYVYQYLASACLNLRCAGKAAVVSGGCGHSA
jgi:hypothetical protein